MNQISYSRDRVVLPQQMAQLFRSAGLNRPVEDMQRMEAMLRGANLLVSAWDGEVLVGLARGLSDYSYCCYLSDLAVEKAYQHQGIGRELLRQVRSAIGEQSMLLLLAAPEAMSYYPRLGFEAVENGWRIKRSR